MELLSQKELELKDLENSQPICIAKNEKAYYKRKDERDAVICHPMGTQWEDALLQTRKRVLMRNQIGHDLDLGLNQSPVLWEKNACCLRHPSVIFCYSSPIDWNSLICEMKDWTEYSPRAVRALGFGPILWSFLFKNKANNSLLTQIRVICISREGMKVKHLY